MTIENTRLFYRNYTKLRKVFTISCAAGIALGLTQDKLEITSIDNVIFDIILNNILQTRSVK